MKKVILVSIITLLVLFICLILYTNDMQMNEFLELRVPWLTRREITGLKDNDIFTEEEVIKIYLSKIQAKNMIKKIEKNENWKKGEIDETLKGILELHTRQKIFYEIPEIKNSYWTFVNRNGGATDSHSVEELLNYYHAVSFGVFDLDNNILYYYRYCG